MQTEHVLHTLSQEEIEEQIDDLDGQDIEPITLILPAGTTTYRYPYKEFQVRAWEHAGVMHYDTAYRV